MEPNEIRKFYADVFDAYRKEFSELPSTKAVLKVLDTFKEDREDKIQFLFEKFRVLDQRAALILSQMLFMSAREEDSKEEVKEEKVEKKSKKGK